MADIDPTVGGLDHKPPVGSQLRRPALAVQAGVVAPAQKDASGRAGGPPVLGVDHVGHIGPRRRAVTARAGPKRNHLGPASEERCRLRALKEPRWFLFGPERQCRSRATTAWNRLAEMVLVAVP